MKTPDEIKKALYQCGRGEFRCSECAYYDESEKRADCGYVLNLHALDLIQHLEAQVPKWISVEERLPDIDAEVLIYTDEGLYDVAQYSGGERFWTLERNPDCWVTASGVTHWMPLPELMKEG